MKDRSNLLDFLLLLFGVFCGSTAVIMIKASSEHPFLVASYRLLVAALVLFPFFLRDLHSMEPGETYGWKQVGWSAVPAVFLAFHFMTWVVGARLTQVANASLIANLTPVVMPFFVWAIFRERVARQEIVGTAFTLLGLVVLSGSNLRFSLDSVRGDLICFVSMLAFAAYLALGRKNGARLRLWLYMVPLYFIAGVICLACALFTINPIKPYTAGNVLFMVGLGLIPTVLGHTILNFSLKRFSSQVVSVANLLQPVFASLLGFLAFQEAPRPLAYVAAALIVTGVLIVLGGQRTVPAAEPA